MLESPPCKPPIDLTHYVIVRSDLPMGFAAAQIVHAAGESSPGNLSQGTNAVVLAIDSECSLHLLSRRLEKAGIRHVLVTEPDPPYHGAATAIGLEPVTDRSTVKKFISGLPLYGGPRRGAAVA